MTPGHRKKKASKSRVNPHRNLGLVASVAHQYSRFIKTQHCLSFSHSLFPIRATIITFLFLYLLVITAVSYTYFLSCNAVFGFRWLECRSIFLFSLSFGIAWPKVSLSYVRRTISLCFVVCEKAVCISIEIRIRADTGCAGRRWVENMDTV